VATHEFRFLRFLVVEFSLISVEAVMDVPALLNSKLFLLHHSKEKHTTLEVQNLLVMMFAVGDIHF
jgi:hypothetical protein